MRSFASNRLRTIDERIAVAFWLAIISVFWSFVGAIGALLLHIDETMLDAAFIGAFMGSTPIMFLPVIARHAWGAGTQFANRDHLYFRMATVGWAVIVSVSRLLGWWPHARHVSTALAELGLVAGVLASWYVPHFPRALKLWVRQQHPLPRTDDLGRPTERAA